MVAPERAKVPYIRTVNIGDLIRHALRSAELPNRPYVLRTTFAQRLLTAESAGKIPHAFAQFWMGHTGDMTARYSVNRGLLPDSTIEEMRAAYHRCEPFLSTAPTPAGGSNAEAYKVVPAPWYTDKEIGEIDLDDPVGSDRGAAEGGGEGRRT